MKVPFGLILTITILHLALQVRSQTITELFSKPGLSINAFHRNYFDGDNPNAWTFLREDTLCGKDVLIYIGNHTAQEKAVYIDDRKVYTQSWFGGCEWDLKYDFGLEIGDFFGSRELVEKYPVELFNGEIRTAFVLRQSQSIHQTIWIEGIGDIDQALFSQPDIEGGDEFVCARVGDETLWESAEHAHRCDVLSCISSILDIEPSLDGFELSVVNNSRYANQFLWDFGDGQFSTEVSPVHTYDQPGCYQLQLTYANDCSGPSSKYIGRYLACQSDAWQINLISDTLYLFSYYRYSDHLHFHWGEEHLYRSTDGGISWQYITIPMPPEAARRIYNIRMFDIARGIMICQHSASSAGTLSAILITQDGGMTWHERAPGSYHLSQLHIAPDGRAWALGQYRYYRSFDFGNSWEDVETIGVESLNDIQYVGGSSLVGIGYTGLQPWGSYHFARSDDNGISWTTTPVFPIWNIQFFDGDNGYCDHRGSGIFRTTDGGTTWDSVAVPFTVDFFAFHSIDTGWLADNNDLIYYTTDGMKTFTVSNCVNHVVSQIMPWSGTDAYGNFRAIRGGPDGYILKHFSMNHVTTCLTDDDDDGFNALDDCDDHNPLINPISIDIPDNGIDENCDGKDLITSASGLNADLDIFPNPVRDVLTIHTATTLELAVRVFDMQGKEISVEVVGGQVGFGRVSAGCYMLHVKDKVSGLYVVRVIVVM